MKNAPKYGLLLLILLGFCLPSSAIVVADYGVAESAPTGDWDINWDFVYNYKNSSAVAVGSHWLLTAAHVGDDGGTGSLTTGTDTYYQQEVIFHDTADLALVRLDKPLPGYYPLYTGDFPSHPPNKKLDAVMVGYGRTGIVYSTYYTEEPSGNGVKRWGSNKIDGLHNGVNYDVGGTTGMTYNDGIQILFTLIDTTYEAGVGIYDSGGGTFVNDGGTWKLAGINTIRYGGPNYTGTFAVSVPAYEAWITQMITQADGDDDSDGIPNWWEDQYGSTTGVVASVDQDGDGATGIDEYIADTDPTDSNMFWQIDGLFTATNQTFTFDGSTARTYQLLYTTNDLADSGLTWTAHGSPIWGSGAGTEIVVTNTEDTVFYRVWVTLP